MGVSLNPFTGQLQLNPASQSGNTIAPYANFAAFPAVTTANNGQFGVALDTGLVYEVIAGTWTVVAGPGDILSVGTIDSQTPSANGAVDHAGQLIMQSASGTVPGLVNNTTQTLSGQKTFSTGLTGTLTGHSTLDIPLTAEGVANGVATLDGGGKIPLSQLPATLMEFEGNWNPNTNTPTLVDGTGTTGFTYWVSAKDTGTVSGLNDPSMTNFQIGNLVIYNGTAWVQVTPAAGTQSVNGAQGAVSLTTASANGFAGTYSGTALTISTTVNSPVLAGNGTAISAATTTGTGSTVVLATSPTLITPDLGTPSALVGTNITGTASGLTAGTVTTNANLTGPIISVGNATSVASQTGTGSTFVMNTSPTLITPALGTPSALVGTNITGTATSFTASNVTTNANLTGGVTSVGNAATVVTNANLTGPITSVGNATSVASQTGTGSTFVMNTGPTMTNPVVGTQTQLNGSTLAASTAYVDTAVANAVSGINPAVAVQAATTSSSNTSGFTYNNGVSGVGATFTGTTNTAVTIDGYTFTALGQRLLVKNDTQSPSGAFNGIYYVTQIQTSLLPPILTRALDYDQPSDINNTGSIPVVNGTVNGTTSWLQIAQIVTVGTTPLVFTQFSQNPSTILTNPMTTGGDIIYGGASGVPTRLANGAAGQVLTSAGSTSAPTWKSPVLPTVSTALVTGAGTGTGGFVSGIYTTPAGVAWFEVEMVGGGGGGSGGGTSVGSTGGTGGNTTFGTSLLVANGGVGSGTNANPGVGGTASVAASSTVIQVAALQGGQGGGATYAGASGATPAGGTGGSTPLGGAGGGAVLSGNGYSAIANSGSGGGGGASSAVASGYGGSGGGAGGYVKAIIYPTAGQTFAYSVGASGAGGTGNTVSNGGAGGLGAIYIIEHYGS